MKKKEAQRDWEFCPRLTARHGGTGFQLSWPTCHLRHATQHYLPLCWPHASLRGHSNVKPLPCLWGAPGLVASAFPAVDWGVAKEGQGPSKFSHHHPRGSRSQMVTREGREAAPGPGRGREDWNGGGDEGSEKRSENHRVSPQEKEPRPGLGVRKEKQMWWGAGAGALRAQEEMNLSPRAWPSGPGLAQPEAGPQTLQRLGFGAAPEALRWDSERTGLPTPVLLPPHPAPHRPLPREILLGAAEWATGKGIWLAVGGLCLQEGGRRAGRCRERPQGEWDGSPRTESGRGSSQVAKSPLLPQGWGLCRVVPLWALVSPSVKWGLFFSGETGGWPST